MMQPTTDILISIGWSIVLIAFLFILYYRGAETENCPNSQGSKKNIINICKSLPSNAKLTPEVLFVTLLLMTIFTTFVFFKIAILDNYVSDNIPLMNFISWIGILWGVFLIFSFVKILLKKNEKGTK